MKLSRNLPLVLLAGVALTACNIPGLGGGGAPTGQVVATVDGQEITSRELDAELADARITDPKARKAAQMNALKQIIERVVIAKAARDQNIDKDPDFVLAEKRLQDSLLAQALQKRIAAQVPAPSREEAEAFIASHPDIFAQCKIWSVDQIRMNTPADPAELKAFEPLNTLPDVEAKLIADHIDYKKGSGTIDAVGADPKLIDAIIKLPPGQIFIIPAPNGQGLLVNQIRDTQVQPFTGEQAVNYAISLLTRQRTEEAVGRTFSALMAKAQPTLKINKDYAPANTPSAPKAG